MQEKKCLCYLQVLTILWSRTSSFGNHRAVAERPCHLEAGAARGGEQGKVWRQASLPLQGAVMVLVFVAAVTLDLKMTFRDVRMFLWGIFKTMSRFLRKISWITI